MTFCVDAGLSALPGEWLKTVPRPATSTRTDRAVAPLVEKIASSDRLSDAAGVAAEALGAPVSTVTTATTTAVRERRMDRRIRSRTEDGSRSPYAMPVLHRGRTRRKGPAETAEPFHCVLGRSGAGVARHAVEGNRVGRGGTSAGHRDLVPGRRRLQQLRADQVRCS